MGSATRAKSSGCGGDVEIGDPVLDGRATAKGDYDEVMGGVQGDISSHTC